MRVRAIKQGYFDLKRRNVGMEFEIPPALFSKTWMVKVGSQSESEDTPSSKRKPKVAMALPQVEIPSDEEDVI